MAFPLSGPKVALRTEGGIIIGGYRTFEHYWEGKAFDAVTPRPIDGMPAANMVIAFPR